MECKVLYPNIIILKPNNNPNCNVNIHNACDMYYDNIGIMDNNYLDIAYNEAIF